MTRKRLPVQIQAWLDSITLEHGDTYVDGIQPVFNTLKACHFDTSWNWVWQDTILNSLCSTTLPGCLTTIDCSDQHR
jgi:fatty acid synthase subunit alpha